MAFHKLRLSLPLPATFSTLDGGGAATAATVGLFFSFFFIWLLQKRRISAKLPPGPYALPIIGNLHQLRLPVHRALKGLADKYGPILFLRLGSVPTVVVSSSEMASHFLKTHDLIFASRPLTSPGKYVFYDFKDVIFAPYGDHWRQMRKLCVLELLTVKRIESFKHFRVQEISGMIDSIWKESDSGRMAVNVSKAISTLTSNIVWLILVNKKFSGDDLVGDFKGFRDLVLEMSATVGALNIGDFIPYLNCLDLQGINSRMKKINKTFNAFAEKLIDEHLNVNNRMAGPWNGKKEAQPHVKDFVDVLLQMAETDTKITRKTIKALVLVCLSRPLPLTYYYF